MSYITNDDIETRVGTTVYLQLADDTGSGSADPVVVDQARLGAEAEVDSYLGTRHAVPIDLTAHPELADTLRRFALDLAVYRLYARKPPVAFDVTVQRDAARKWLERVANGEVVLPAASEPAGTTITGPVGAASGQSRTMSRKDLHDL